MNDFGCRTPQISPTDIRKTGEGQSDIMKKLLCSQAKCAVGVSSTVKNLCHRLGQTAISLTNQHIKILTDSPAHVPPAALCPLKKHYAELGARIKGSGGGEEREATLCLRETLLIKQ